MIGETALTQAERDRKWRDRNKEHSNYLKARSSCRSFIKNKATTGDVDELEKLLAIRKKEINK